MKKIIHLICLCFLLAATTTTLRAQCINGNLELGNLTGWQTWYGGYNTANTAMTPGVTTIPNGSPFPRPTAEVEPAPGSLPNIDWWVQSQLPKVWEGNHSIRIGDVFKSYPNPIPNSTMAAYSFEVTNANKIFKFWYAVEMQNLPHTSALEQPDFSWFMKLGPATTANSAIPTGPTDPSYGIYQLTKFTKALPMDPTTDPWFTPGTPLSGPNNIWIRPWSCQQYDLTPWVGQIVTIYYKTRDCIENGHYAYAYVDGLCSSTNPVASATLPTTACWNPETPILLDGTASQFEDGYDITIVQQFPPETPLLTVLRSWYTGSFYGQAGVKDIRELYRDVNGKSRFQCGATYNVTFNVRNSCGSANALQKQITFTCPSVNAGPDKVVCCGQPVTIGQSVSSGRYAWSPMPAGAVSNGPYITFTPTQDATYTINVEDAGRCRNSDAVRVDVKNDFTVSVTETCPPSNSTDWIAACNMTLSAVVTEIACGGVNSTAINPAEYTYSWQINGKTFTGQTIYKPPYDPNYGADVKLTVSNGCFTKTILFTQTCKKFTGDFTEVIMPAVVRPNSPIEINRVLFIKQYGDLPNWEDGSPGAYNASGYQLMVWHRWGDQTSLVYNSGIVIDHTGLEQGQIVWAPASNLQSGLYVYKLWLYNCSYPNGKLVQQAVNSLYPGFNPSGIYSVEVEY